MNWRRWVNAIHRDLGYLCFGLTVVYAISGVAVNHIHEWNPGYSIERVNRRIEPLGVTGVPLSKDAVQEILGRLGETKPAVNMFQPAADSVQIFTEGGGVITVNLASGEVMQERARTRSPLYEMNFLHLNHPKKWWTWMADLYAVSLIVLAVTGLFILRGRQGLLGRGGWLTGAGIVIPLGFLWMYL